MAKKVLLVAHCGPDTSRIEKVLNELDATYEGAFNHEGGLDKLRKGDFDLVLPNRVFGSDEKGGVKFIRAMKMDPELSKIPVMLVSGYTDAQQEAVVAGAEMGFGKDELEDGGAAEKLRKILL